MNTPPSFSKLLLPLVISAALAGCGGSSGGGSGDTGGGDTSTPVSVSGKASKGVVLGGVVNAYLITATGEKGDLVAGPVTTSTEDGSYTLELGGDYDGSALIIEITGADDDSTLMKCDLAVCKDGVVFGDTYELPSTFAMSAVSPGTAETTLSINITPLTNVASALTLSKVAAGASAADAALATNVQIASKFGITGDLTQLPIVDITDADAVNGADADALEYNLKAAAVVQAAVGSGGAALEDALSNFTTQYVASGIADTDGGTDDENVVTLEEILEASAALVDSIKSVEGVDLENENLTSVESEIDAEEADKQNNGSTDADQGEIPDDIGAPGLVASKAFVQQVRNLANTTAVNLDDNLSIFSNQIDLAEAATEVDTEIAMEALGYAMEAIVLAVESGAETSGEYNGITVVVSNGTYSVEQDILVGETSVAVELTASVAVVDNLEYSETQTQETESGTLSADLSISGSATTSAVAVSIAEGSGFTAALEVDYERNYEETNAGYTDTVSDLITVTDLEASLEATIEQLGADDPVTFTGSIAMTVDFFESDYSDEYSGTYYNDATGAYSNTASETEINSIDGLSLTLSGEFSNASGSSMMASVALAASGIEETCAYNFESGYNSTDGEIYVESDECNLTETESTFASASLTLITSFDLAGMQNSVNMQASATRTGLDAGELAIELTYGGSQLDFAYTGGDSVTITNQAGVVLTLTETEASDGTTSVSGTIAQDGSTYAEVDDDAGVVTITFSDGVFETL